MVGEVAGRSKEPYGLLSSSFHMLADAGMRADASTRGLTGNLGSE